MEEIIDNITEQDMPNEDMRLVYRECGCDVALALLEKFDGMKIYVPSNGFRRIKAKLIIQNGDNMSPVDLAMKFKVPLATVYDILRNRGREERQISFLGDKHEHSKD